MHVYFCQLFFFFVCARSADVQVQREAPTASDPLGGHGLRGRGWDVAHRASLSEQSEGRVVKRGGADCIQKPGGANEPTACSHTQPGWGTFLHKVHTLKRTQKAGTVLMEYKHRCVLPQTAL